MLHHEAGLPWLQYIVQRLHAGADEHPSAAAPMHMFWIVLRRVCLPCMPQKFLSHCAPDDPTTMAPEQMSVPLLRKALKGRGLAATGNKAALVAELTAALAAEAAQAAASLPGEHHELRVRTCVLKPAGRAVFMIQTCTVDFGAAQVCCTSAAHQELPARWSFPA